LTACSDRTLSERQPSRSAALRHWSFDIRHSSLVIVPPGWASSTSDPGGGKKHGGGFTLFEVLIAMALSTILVAAVYTALRLHLSRTQRGYADVEQTGVARGVLRKIGADLRTAIYHTPESASQQPAGTDDEGSGGAAEQQQEAIVTSAEIGLWGETDWVLFDVGLPMRRLLTAESAATDVESLTAMHLVLYALDEGSREQEPGLVRKEISREQAELVGFDMRSLFDVAESTELLAVEVKQLAFRYYDGLDWQTSWDSTLMGGLPRAVEILIGVAPINGEQEEVPYRLVIALPTSSANRVADDYQSLQGEEAGS
jgi:prepilin-type N-terminal cleavage/methylation domain-containing protein